VEWLRSTRNSGENGSIGWKKMMEAFPLISEGLAWKIGNGKEVWVGEDPWEGSRMRYHLSDGLIEVLHTRGIFSIWDARVRDLDLLWAH
jgi:hypothetical protein